METGYIYALIDPRDGAVRYVGQTVGALRSRLAGHLSTPTNQHMYGWIKELNARNIQPTIILIEACTRDQLNDRERYWIETLRSRGIDLLNTSRGLRKQPVTHVDRATFQFRLKTRLIERVAEIATQENRSTREQLEYWLRECIDEYRG